MGDLLPFVSSSVHTGGFILPAFQSSLKIVSSVSQSRACTYRSNAVVNFQHTFAFYLEVKHWNIFFLLNLINIARTKELKHMKNRRLTHWHNPDTLMKDRIYFKLWAHVEISVWTVCSLDWWYFDKWNNTSTLDIVYQKMLHNRTRAMI